VVKTNHPYWIPNDFIVIEIFPGIMNFEILPSVPAVLDPIVIALGIACRIIEALIVFPED